MAVRMLCPVSSNGIGETFPEWGSVALLESASRAPRLEERGSLRLLLSLESAFRFRLLTFFFLW